MLKHLTIKNYALIRHLELQPSPHLNVVTGETGAGKSIMLGAIGLLMGNRADTKVLWDENEKCVTEGVFHVAGYKLKPVFKAEDLDYDDVTIIRREISAGGKSRAFINDTPVTLEVLKRIGNLLMDIHSQHETLQLGSHDFQLRVVDAYADNVALRETYHENWLLFVKTRKEYDQLVREADTLKQEADYIRFQLEELTKASIHENEQEALESELKIMDHAEEIKSKFQYILQVLRESEYAALTHLREAKSAFQQLTGYSARYESLYARFESVLIELNDVLDEIEKEESDIEFDPERSAFVKERLTTIYNLLKKHRVQDAKELLALQAGLEQKNGLASNLDENIERARQAFHDAEKQVRSAAHELSSSRRKALQPLSKRITKLLQDLGMPDARFEVECQATDLSVTGMDKVEILFSANKGIPPRPLSQVASGGEFSRVMFSIKYVMTEKTSMPTLILDEIDTGVSGEVAIRLGSMMKSMAEKHQIIAISHLPQIAAKGNAHYFVYKDNTASKTITSIKLLNHQERVEEIAKMIGGANPSRVAKESAQELIAS